MRIYLDTCSLQRPLDARTSPRIHLEAEAILDVFALCETGQVTLIGSEVLQFETERIQDSLRRALAYEALARANGYVDTTDAVIRRAQHFQEAGMRPLDALHLASAIEAKVDYFCTSDEKLLRRGKALSTESTKVVSPLELIMELSS
jgi:predicted nucleic acid-binding protein